MHEIVKARTHWVQAAQAACFKDGAALLYLKPMAQPERRQVGIAQRGEDPA
jgi:hypothetical protein